jgi:hypothetical protein
MVARLCLDVRAARPVGCGKSRDCKGGEEAVGEGKEEGEEGGRLNPMAIFPVGKGSQA